MIKKTWFLVVLFMLVCSPAWATDYYVTSSGAGSKNGTTLGNAWDINQFNALTGDKGGHTYYFSGTISQAISPSIYGTSGSGYVTLDGLSGGDYNAIAETGGSPAVVSFSSGEGILLNNLSYIIVQDFEVTGMGDGIVYIDACDHIIIRRNHVHDVHERGIFGSTSTWSNYSQYITIGGSAGNGNQCKNNGGGVYSSGNDIKASFTRDCVISYNKCWGDNNKGIGGISWEGDGGAMCERFLVEYNLSFNHNYGGNLGDGEDGIGGKGGTDIIIRFNTVYGHRGLWSQGISVWGDATNHYVYGNLVYNNDINIFVASGIDGRPDEPNWAGNGIHTGPAYIWANITHSAARYSGVLTGSSGQGPDYCENIYIINNTIVQNPDNEENTTECGINLRSGTRYVTAKNNILYDNRSSYAAKHQLYSSIGAQTTGNNTSYHASGTAVWNLGSGGINPSTTGSNNTVENPNFTNPSIGNYTLLATSPCIDTGASLSGPSYSSAMMTFMNDYGGVHYYSDVLDPSYCDFSTTPPTVRMISQGTEPEKGAYAYGGGGPVVDYPPDTSITSPIPNTKTVEVNDEVLLSADSYDNEGDACTYTWVIPTNMFKVWDGGTTYDAGDLVEDDGVAGAYYKSKAGGNLNHNPPNATYWDDAEAQQIPGTGVCDLKGIYAYKVTANDGTSDDDTPAEATITVEDTDTSMQTDTWGRNTTDDYDEGDDAYLIETYPTANTSTLAVFWIEEDASEADSRRGILSFDLDHVDIAGETLRDAYLNLWLKTAPSNTYTVIEIWSCSDEFVTAEATWDEYSDGNAWTGTHGKDTYLGQRWFVPGSSTGEYWAFSGVAFTQYVATKVLAGDPVYFNIVADTEDAGIAVFTTGEGTDGNRPYLQISYGGQEDTTVPEVIRVICDIDDGSYSYFYDDQENIITGGKFSKSTDWSRIGPWFVDNGVASIDGSQSIPATLYQIVPAYKYTDGYEYGVTFTVSDYVAGEVTPYIGNSGGGTARSANGTYSEVITWTDHVSLPGAVKLSADTNFDGAVDNFYLTPPIGPFYVTFSEPVVVTGTPQLTLETGATDVVLDYVSGSGTATLTFAPFAIAEGHTTADLDATQLDLNGGTIVSADDATAVADTADILDTFPTGADAGSLASLKSIVLDSTDPTIDSVNNTNVDPTATPDSTITAPDTLVLWSIVTSETGLQITAEPGYPTIEMEAHPVDTVYAQPMGLGDTTGTIMMGFYTDDGMRTPDLNFTGNIITTGGGSITDEAGNDAAVSMGALDLSSGAAIVLKVPAPSTDPWVLSSSGDYATFAAFDTATYSVPDDFFTCDFTGDLDTEVAGTSGHVIEVNGTIVGDITVDQQYWTFEDLDITGGINVSAANTIIRRVKITP